MYYHINKICLFYCIDIQFFFYQKKDYSKPLSYDKFILQSAMIEQSSVLLAE